MNDRGFSVVEITIAILLLAVMSASVFTLIGFANRGTMDSYFEFLALALAREPIEVFRAFGYHWLREYEKHPLPKYPLGFSIVSDANLGIEQYPKDATAFVRHISFRPLEKDGLKALTVRVTILPAEEGWVLPWFRRDEVALEATFVESE